MKQLTFTLLLGITTVHMWAQEAQNNAQGTPEPAPPKKQERKAQPSNLTPRSGELTNYGSLVIDGGFDFLRNCPQEMALNFLGSRFSNVYFYYNIRLGQSHFAISPGLGLGLEGYRFKAQNDQYTTLVRNEDSRYTEFKDARQLFPKSEETLQSNLDLSYLDFMLEVRFSANCKYPKESFFVAIGGKLGMLWGAATTIKYKEDAQIKQRIDVECFNLNQMRYGAHARLGWGRFSLFYTQTLSTLFNEDQGPGKTTTNPYSVGLSVDLF